MAKKDDKNDEKMLINELPLKWRLFVKHYINKDADTFQNGLKSAIASKYSEKSAHNTASKLLRNGKIKAAIEEGWAKLLDGLGLSRGYVIAGIMHNEQKLREAGDYKGAEICTRDLGMTLALFSDKMIIEESKSKNSEPRERTEQQREADKVAANAFNEAMSKCKYPRLEKARPAG